jgi:hypothetical protein
MPKLKLTYLQIKEQAARDIRNRTRARKGQLLEVQKQNTARDIESDTEDFYDTDSDTEDIEKPEQTGFSYNVQLCFLVLLLFFLLYHACK